MLVGKNVCMDNSQAEHRHDVTAGTAGIVTPDADREARNAGPNSGHESFTASVVTSTRG